MTRKFNRKILGSVLLAVAALASAGSTCRFDSYGILIPQRDPPVIGATTPAQATLTRRFTVDLSQYADAATITWEFGDGDVAHDLSRHDGQEVTHAYRTPGTFTVKVHLFSWRSLTDQSIQLLATGQLPVNVIGPNQPPVARFFISDVSGLEGAGPHTLKFDGSASSDVDGQIVKFEWDFGDGASDADTGGVVQHAYAVAGRFEVTLTVTDDRGGTDFATQTAIANTPPVAAFTATVVNDAQGQPQPQVFSFSAAASSDSDGTIQSYRWNFGDNSPEVSGVTVQHTFPNPGEFSVTLTVTDDLDGTDTDTQMIDATGTDPFIASISPRLGEVDAVVTIQISGFNFTANPTVRLTSPSNPTITATNAVLMDNHRVDATFNLAGVPLGVRTLVLIDTGAHTTTLADGFTIVTPDHVRLVTSLGDIVLQLDRAHAPNTVLNFFRYVEEGFYDNTVFHRVVDTPNPFVIQGGAFESLGMGADPRLREKMAHAAINSEANNGLSNLRGTIAMALRGQNANSATSQFFINLADNTSLDTGPPPFTVFGKVIAGLSTVDAIAAVQVGTFNVTAFDANGNTTTTSFDNVPVTDVTVIRVVRE